MTERGLVVGFEGKEGKEGEKGFVGSG